MRRRVSPVHGERRSAPAHHFRPQQGPRQPNPEPGNRLSGHGRPHHPVSAARIGKDRACAAARRGAGAALDGRDERRLLMPVSDVDARHRPASGSADGGRAVLGLQSLAHGKGAAGGRRALVLDAHAAALRPRCLHAADRNLRRAQIRDRVHDHLRALAADSSQFAYEDIPRAGRARARARLPFRHQPDRARVQEPQPFRLGARAGLSLLQHPACDQLGHQRAGRAVSQAPGDLDRRRPRLDPVPDAAPRP